MKVALPYFDNAQVELEDENGNLEEQEAHQALKAFLSLTRTDRFKDSRHVFAYFNDFRAAVEGEDWWDNTKDYPEQAHEIWRHVTPGPVAVEQGNGDDHAWYIVVEAECDWEIEHGLMMVWKDGNDLCKVGGFDGHLSNETAYGEERHTKIVYQALDPKYSTFA